MRGEGYRFRFRTSKVQVLLGYAGAAGAAVLAGLLAVLAARAPGPLPRIGCLAGATVLVVLCAASFRRVLLQAFDLRIGVTGVYFESLRTKRYVEWNDIVRIEADTRTVRLIHRTEGGRVEEVWVDVADDQARFRVRVFSQEHLSTTEDRTTS
ncbi:hypothetical protein ACFL59_14980 [Planctomycetota bacterium]